MVLIGRTKKKRSQVHIDMGFSSHLVESKGEHSIKSWYSF